MWTKKNIPNQTGKTVIVTGANVGIGFETALALYEAGKAYEKLYIKPINS
jgi:NADP-dependent 3-hydroxy acid dehydrogenase YdfG